MKNYFFKNTLHGPHETHDFTFARMRRMEFYTSHISENSFMRLHASHASCFKTFRIFMCGGGYTAPRKGELL